MRLTKPIEQAITETEDELAVVRSQLVFLEQSRRANLHCKCRTLAAEDSAKIRGKTVRARNLEGQLAVLKTARQPVAAG